VKLALETFGSRQESEWLTPAHQSYRPPSWPPPRDWVVSEDRDGQAISRWGDPVWDITPWAGRSMILDFGDGAVPRKATPLSGANADLLRILTTWRMWGPKGCIAANTLKATFLGIRRVIALCEENGILASHLMRYPKVFEQLPTRIPVSEFAKTVVEFHRLWDVRDELGFSVLDAEGLRRLAAAAPQRETEQTAYIPPRIWAYQVERLRSCLDDFIAHKQELEDCFNFCVDAYAHNFGSLSAAFGGVARHRLPFWAPSSEGKGSQSGCMYHGRFGLTAARYGIDSLIDTWTGVAVEKQEVRTLSSYLSLVQHAGLAYIANFTLQRISEAASLRSDCLLWEDDEKVGRVPIICGETTKTDPDSDARWPTSPSVAVAVEAMSLISRMRMRCAVANPMSRPSVSDQDAPYLLGPTSEPWSPAISKPYSIRLNTASYASICTRFDRLFDPEQLRITEEDLKIARMLTPNLSEKKGFAVGEIWPFAWHQLRRTGAVNMFSSSLLSDSSMQFQMKHASRLMPLYYGRGYSKLHLNEEVESVIIEAMYEAMAGKLRLAMTDRYVSPLGKARKEAIAVNLIGEKDAKELVSAGRKGQIFFREMRLGGCTHRGTCSYGGIESISRCAGGDGYGPCADVLYDREKVAEIERELVMIQEEIESAQASTPRYKALVAERQAMENFLDVVRS